MITFYPGPSRVNSKLPRYFKDAYLDGIMGINHRSPEFEGIYKQCISMLKENLQIPEDYAVFFTSSATECWEIIAQSLISKESFHVYNGAFGEKWSVYTHKLKKKTTQYEFNLEETLKPKVLPVPDEAEMVGITQNETSNGTQISNKIIKKIKKRYQERLIAVDATSSMGGINLEWSVADIWYASVQKCFGLPAGLAVMVCSPQALQRAKALQEMNHYNSLLSIREKGNLNQTTHTPNVLNIYFLLRVMEDAKAIPLVSARIEKQYRQWERFFQRFETLEFLVKNKKVRSNTVLAIRSKENKVGEIKDAAKKAGIVLGNGYGKYKKDTFRIANFPAIKKKEIKLLKEFLSNNVK